MPLALRLSFAIALLTASRVAAAREVPVRLDLTAAPCVDAAAFSRALAERQPSLMQVGSNEELVVRIEVDGVAPELRARLSFAERGGAVQTRELAARTCDELGSALVLITALAYDSWVEDKVAAASATAPRAPRARAPVADAPVVEAPLEGAASTRIELGVFGSIRAFGTPSSAPGMALRAALFRPQPGTWLRREVSLGASATFVRSEEPPASAALVLASLEACPVGVAASGIEGALCAGISGGVFSASADDVLRASPRTRPWVEPTLGGRLRIDVTRAVGFGAFLGASTPLVRDELVVEPRRTAFLASPVNLVAQFGIIATIW